MGARGLVKMVVALLAVIFGAMMLAGEGPEVAMGSDEPEMTAEELAALDITDDTAPETVSPETITKAGATPVLLAAAQDEPVPAPEPEPVLEAALGAATDAAVEASLANIEPAAAEPTELTTLGVVLGRRVNVRSGPSTGNEVIGQVFENQEVEILGYEDNGWARIILDGEVGFMSGNFLRELPQG